MNEEITILTIVAVALFSTTFGLWLGARIEAVNAKAWRELAESRRNGAWQVKTTVTRGPVYAAPVTGETVTEKECNHCTGRGDGECTVGEPKG